jgi:membrane-associated phospholipid phosphatase
MALKINQYILTLCFQLCFDGALVVKTCTIMTLIKVQSLTVKKRIYLNLHHVRNRLSPLVATIGTVGLIICLIVLLGLSWLCQEVWEKEAFGLDTTILLWLRQWTSPGLDRVMLTFTTLGNPEFVVTLVMFSLGWLWRSQRFLEMKVFMIACLGALILNQELKVFFAKPRPQLWPRLINEETYSFPSGHALGSLVLYGFLAYVLAEQFPRFSRWIYGFAVALIAVIGFSRLYLGVHWPTDVVAGYAVGFLWLITCITMIRLQTQVMRSQD